MFNHIKTKIFVFALSIASFINVSDAISQTVTTGGSLSDQVSLNIVLQTVQSIVVNPLQKVVDFVYESVDDYSDGVTKEMSDHLTIFSNGGFEVTVKSENKHFKLVDGGKSIFVSDMNVTASEGSNINYSEGFSTITLDNKALKIITSSKGGSGLKYNVIYDNTAGGKNNYLIEYVNKTNANGIMEAIFSTDITYSLVAK